VVKLYMDPKTNLSPEAYNVCFLKGTEPPGSGKYLHNKKNGKYVCVVCGNKLFESNTKYDSGTGWPSFWDMADPKAIKTENDVSFGMTRTEVLCAKCGSHLGHVFTDGPVDKTGLWYCINSLALDFKEDESSKP
jgi:peptide-methionine (R)-S-oxide reductase